MGTLMGNGVLKIELGQGRCNLSSRGKVCLVFYSDQFVPTIEISPTTLTTMIQLCGNSLEVPVFDVQPRLLHDLALRCHLPRGPQFWPP
jgi:hypothetical protein